MFERFREKRKMRKEQNQINNFNSQMKSNLLRSMQDIFLNGIYQNDNQTVNVHCDFGKNRKNFRKKSENSHDPRVEEKEQEKHYQQAMDIINGDRDSIHYPRESIEAKTFRNDTLTSDERDEVIDIINSINHAIGCPKEQPEEQRKPSQSTGRIFDVIGSISEMFAESMKPIVSMLFSFASGIMAISIMGKMSKIVQSI